MEYDEMGRIITSNNLSDEDKDNAKKLVLWLKKRKEQNLPPITQKEIIKLTGKYTEHSFSAIINYARISLDEWIVSCNEGLFYAETEQEKKEFLEYYESLIFERLRVLNWIKKKLAEDQKKNQVGLFTEVEQVAIYGETLEDALIRIGARKVNGAE